MNQAVVAEAKAPHRRNSWKANHGDSAEAADDSMRHAARRTPPEGMSEQKRRDVRRAIESEVDATDPECFFPPSNT